MGLLQNAITTYDTWENLAGIYEEGKTPLAPVGHAIRNASIEITIDTKGSFVRATMFDEKERIIIPVTEKSGGRSSGVAAHPLCENLKYLIPSNENYYKAYIEQLAKWCASPYRHPKAEAVLRYVSRGSIIDDLTNADCSKVMKDNPLVCWRVLTGDETGGPVWTDLSLMSSYTQYYLSTFHTSPQFCMVDGDMKVPASKHAPGIIAAATANNARLISANDKKYFTFLGRFTSKEEALSISYEASQKAHNALKWLIDTQGIWLGGVRTMICWSPQGKRLPRADRGLRSQTKTKTTLSDDRAALNKIIYGYKRDLDLTDNAVIATIDSATPGRLSIVYYCEMGATDFLDRLRFWEETCCWYDNRFGVSSPSIYDIVQYAYGTIQKNKATQHEEVVIKDKIKAHHLQRMLSCKIDGAKFPLDIMRALVQKCNNMQVYGTEHRNKLLLTTCASIRKYKFDHYQEEWHMALEPERKDRSYQYGRLLAVMEKAECDTYRTDDEQKRTTNAIRMQSMFVMRPEYASSVVMNRLKTAYYPQLKPAARIFYEQLIGQIMDVISSCDEDHGGLKETYLMGYYLQKNSLYTKKDDTEKTKNNGKTEE